MSHRISRAALAAVLVTLAAALAVGAGSAGAAKATAKADNPKFATEGGVAPQFLANARTIPHFTFQYTDPSNGVTYPITMVGSDPRSGNGDTTVNDAFMRAQFGKIGSGYHVRLQNVKRYATQTINVPASQGVAYNRAAAESAGKEATAGIVEDKWFSEKLQNLMNALHVDATTVPIFLTDNVMLYDGTYDNCCTIGYHGAGMPIGHGAGSASGKGTNPVQTFIYSAWSKPGTYSGFYSDYSGTRTYPSPTRGIADIHALSHEVAEWLDDPYVNNAVKPWLTPTAPQYGCTGVLETGDPVVGDWFPLAGNTTADGYDYYGEYHPEENVFAQWYGHGGLEAAGFHSWDGRLTFMGSRTTSLGGPVGGLRELLERLLADG